jgi:hypothetical protein
MLGARERLKMFAMCIECPSKLERRGGDFIAPQENLAIGVSEIRICPGRGRTCSAHLFGTWLADRICPVWDLVAEEIWLGRTCPTILSGTRLGYWICSV